MKNKKNKVFLVVEEWSYKGDYNPALFVVFSNIEAARKHLKKLIEKDKKDGISSKYDEKYIGSQELEETEDEYSFSDDHSSSWVTFAIVEKQVNDD